MPTARLALALVAFAPWVARAASPAAPDEVAVAYHGDFVTHPGLAARIGWDLAPSEPVALLLEIEAGGYWHPDLMVALFARTGPAVRWTGPRGGTYGAFAHVGLEHGFWAAPTYRVEDGEVRSAVLAGDSWGIFMGGLELGHTLRSGPLGAWFVRPQAGFRFLTFHTVGVDVAVAAGVTFR